MQDMLRFRIRKVQLVTKIAGFAAAALLGMSGWIAFGRSTAGTPLASPREGMVDWVGPATSLAEMERESEIIVVGQVVEIVSTDRVYPIGYDALGRHLPEDMDPGITFTNLEVKVTRYLKGEGSPAITLRQSGDLAKTNGLLEFPKPTFGEPMILFLTAEHDRGENVWASSRGPWGRLAAHDGSIFYAWGDGPREVSWAAGMTLEQSAASIEEAVGSARSE